MSTCDNIGIGKSHCGEFGHYLEYHSVDANNPNILRCYYPTIELGPHGEYWRKYSCVAKCVSFNTNGSDNRNIETPDVEPRIIFRTSKEAHRIYEFNIKSSGPEYSLTYKRTDGEEHILKVSNSSLKYVDVTQSNSFVTVQALSGKGSVETKIIFVR